jgi:hypothetical protein
MNQPISNRFPRIGLLQIAIILLAVITALIHLYLSVRGFMLGRGGPLQIMFILNFVGYIVLVTALYLPPLQGIQSITRWILIAFTIVTVIMWYLISGSHPGIEDYVDKSVELVLIILLLVEAFRPRPRKAC